MHLKHFGDSYDIVKKSLLGWLSDLGPWAAHPMFTHEVSETEAQAFSRFLGVPLISTAVLNPVTDRHAYLEPVGDWNSLFLDPDTGVRISRESGRRSSEFLFVDELRALALHRPSGVIMAFDQSLPRGSERVSVSRKLAELAGGGVYGFAYVSHASFLILSASGDVAERARTLVAEASALPAERLLRGPGM